MTELNCAKDKSKKRNQTKANNSVLKIGFFLVIVVGTSLALWTNSKSQCYDATKTAMSTVIKFHLFPSASESQEDMRTLVDKQMKELNALEYDVLSYREKSSEIAKLNRKTGTAQSVSPQLYQWLQQIYDIENASNGALDVTICPLARLWNIEGEHPVVPSQDSIRQTLKLVDYMRMTFPKQNQVQIKPETSVDLGAVGKGIACDVLADTMRKNNPKTSGTISVGGSIAVVGTKPKGEDWNMGIQDPRGETGEAMGTLKMQEGFLSTSGDYEKTFTQNGISYHHILDSKTGYPARSGLISVTIVCDNGLDSDALSTACFVLGVEKGTKLAQQFGAESIMIDEHKRVYVSKGLRNRFTILNSDYKLVDK